MFKTCPGPIDVQDLQFKLHCRLKVFNNKELNSFPKSNSLISCASRYGLLFVGSNISNLQVIQTKCVENYTPKLKDISDYPRRNVPLPSPPQHVCVNCDSTILAVVTERDNCPSVTFYDVLSFFKQNISIIKEVRLSSTPGIYVREIGWNPALPCIFTACKSDGTLGVYEIKGTSININELPAASEATCFCWSPKGKQIAVGSKNSRITQYKPDLKAVKVVNQPPLETPHCLISLQWVSNYQFIGIYQSVEPDGSAKLIVVDAPKTGDPVYTNYEDVCYSGTARLPQFYMILQQHWNILMVASSNSTELGVLGSVGDTWTQWIISDSARAELPLSPERQETLPVGLALDISSTRPVPWNESTIPPCPYLLILSHQGILCLFNVVNLKDGVPSICTPPDSISDLTGIQQFVTPINNPVNSPPAEPSKVASPSVNITQNTPVSSVKVLTQPQATYAAPAPLFGAKPAEVKPLFGGQTVLTPIKPQQTTAQPLFGAQTFITPINKQQSTTAANANTAEKYSAIFSALNTPAAVPPPTASKPIIISSQTISKPMPPPVEQPVIQPNITTTPVKPVEPPKPVVNLKIKEETDILLAQMLRDESTSLESELKALLHQGKLLDINIGSENEKVELVTKIESLQEFIKEIVDISIGENAEVHYLKQNLIQSWAWYEEARSRYNASKDETVSLLLRSQPLDSATEKKQADIRKLMYYIESQITQASKALDEQWDNFQDYAKKVHRTKMPTMEAIFQAMVRQNGILQKQCYILKDIASRLKGRGRGTNLPSLLLSMENTKDLEESLIRLKIEHPQDIYQMQYQRVLNRTKNLSETKSNKLRNLLKNREVLHVTAVKPQLSASLMLQSPESKSKRLLSNLASLGVSPLPAAAPAPKALSFLHSTPIRESKSEVKPSETQPDAKIFTFKKAEKSNLTPTTNSFIPLSKSASVFSNLPQGSLTQAPIATHSPSAFVPTQVNFGGGGKFSFASTPTTTATASAKIVTISLGTTTVPTFSFASTALPKFSAPTTPKTPEASTPTSSTKTSFNFGSGLTIVPLGTNKKDTTTTTATNVAFFETATTTKPGFNFGDTSNLFGAKVTAASSPQVSVATSSGNLFGNLAQANKSSSATTVASSSSTFGAVANMSKLSAFSAVSTTAVPAVTASLTSKPEDLTQTQTKPSVFANTFATDAGLTKLTTTSSTFANFGVVPTTTKTILTIPNVSSAKASTAVGNSAVPATIAATTPITTSSMFGSVTDKPLSMFQTSSTPVVTTEATSSTTPAFSVPTTTKQSVAPGTLVTTPSVSTVSSGTLVFNVTTSTSTKPTLSVTSSASTGALSQNVPFGAALSTSNVTTTAPAASVFTSNASSATTKPSFFGVATTTPQSSIFASPSASQPSSFSTATTQLQGISISSATAADTTVTVAQPSVFGPTKDITSGAGAQSFFGTAKPASSQSSIFSSAAAPSQPSIFGNTTSGVGTTTQSTSIFGSDTTISPSQPSIFGSAVPSTQSSIFGETQSSGVSTTTQTTSIFNTSNAVPSGQTSVFGATPSTKPSIFDSATPKTTATSLFGSVAITTAQSSIFGGSSTNSAAKSSIFSTTPASNQSSIFGTNPVASTQQSSIFGGGANTSSGSFFGSTPGATTAQTSIFGGGKSPTTTKSSIFGASQTGTTQSSIFATNTAPSTQTSVFGAPSTTSSSPFSSGFGSTPALSSPFGQISPGFGVPKTTTTTFTSGFGSPTGFGATPSTTSSIFGQPTSVFGTPTTATNMFGSSTSTFGGNTSDNVFGSPVSSASSSFSFAGPASNTSNTGAFGFGGLNVGSSATTNSVFGGGAAFGQATAANPFGRTTEQKSPFGGGGTSVFGNAASSSGSIFGSGSNTGSTFSSNTQGGGFGNSSFGSPSAFGQQAAFGQSSFGNTSFGNTQPGPFSGGSAAVAQTGFGSPTSFSKPSGFGSPPAFGGSPQPAFGGGPSFGAAPAFGTAATFGSPNKIFGASTPTAGFGSASTANAGFGNLANQNTVGFGNLAQQATTPNATPFSGSSSFSTWR